MRRRREWRDGGRGGEERVREGEREGGGERGERRRRERGERDERVDEVRDDLSGVSPPVAAEILKSKLDNSTNYTFPTLIKFTCRVPISPSVFNGLQTVLHHRTTSGLHSQTYTSLHSRQSRLFHGKSRTSTFTKQDCWLLHTKTRSTLRSCRPTIKCKVSLSCHSFKLSDISAESSCNLFISRTRTIQLSRPPRFPSAVLISNSAF